MLRLTSRRLLLDKLGNTKLGAEVLTQTRRDMKHIENTDNFVVRFLTRRRPIDYLAIEVDGPITKELSPTFVYAKHAFTALLCLPVFALTLTGVLSPTYYLLVPTRLMSADKYERMWEFSNRWTVLMGQAVLCLVFYDFSVYIRYPFFAKVLAPLYRSQGWLRELPKASFTAEQLRNGAAMRGAAAARAPRPLGRPLGEVKRARQAEAPQPHPFGKPTGTTRQRPASAASSARQRE